MTRIASLTKITVALVFAALWTVAPAQISKKGAGYLFRIKWTKGQTAKYTMTTTTSGGPSAMAVNMPMSLKVLSVAGGVGEVEYNVGPASANGKPMGAAQKVVAKVDPRGKIVSGATQAQQMGGNITFPEGPVKPGGTWTGSQTVPGPGGSMTINAKYKFVGIKSVGGQSVAQIDVSMSGGGGQMQITGSGSVFLRTADGSLQSTNLGQKLTISGAQGNQKPMTIDMKISMKRA
ncbi:MAG: hypothetical protein M9921_00590 [Fimbriimonadaceae bacterium]|nr:hypothetical protein [Fimbriimonadaceae bacterium]